MKKERAPGKEKYYYFIYDVILGKKFINGPIYTTQTRSLSAHH
jgi:hypothetical protein